MIFFNTTPNFLLGYTQKATKDQSIDTYIQIISELYRKDISLNQFEEALSILQKVLSVLKGLND